MAKNFRLNHAGARKLLNSDEVRAELERRADRVRAAADRNAPVGETGELSQSHEVESDTTDRAVARVYTNLPYAITVEANTGYLSKSLDEAGDAGE